MRWQVRRRREIKHQLQMTGGRGEGTCWRNASPLWLQLRLLPYGPSDLFLDLSVLAMTQSCTLSSLARSSAGACLGILNMTPGLEVSLGLCCGWGWDVGCRKSLVSVWGRRGPLASHARTRVLLVGCHSASQHPTLGMETHGCSVPVSLRSCKFYKGLPIMSLLGSVCLASAKLWLPPRSLGITKKQECEYQGADGWVKGSHSHFISREAPCQLLPSLTHGFQPSAWPPALAGPPW